MRFLERGLAGHGTLTAGDGEEGARLAATEPVDLVLLDIMLPRLDGHQTLRRIRLRRPGLPVLILTARDEVQQKVGALDAGADDYLTKPFDLEELLARIRALTRPSDQPYSSKMVFGDLKVNLRSRRVRRGERQLGLSSREFALLEYSMSHVGQVLSRQQIFSAVWDLRLRPWLERRGRLRQVPQEQARPPRRTLDHPDRPRRWLPLRTGRHQYLLKTPAISFQN